MCWSVIEDVMICYRRCTYLLLKLMYCSLIEDVLSVIEEELICHWRCTIFSRRNAVIDYVLIRNQRCFDMLSKMCWCVVEYVMICYRKCTNLLSKMYWSVFKCVLICNRWCADLLLKMCWSVIVDVLICIEEEMICYRRCTHLLYCYRRCS